MLTAILVLTKPNKTPCDIHKSAIEEFARK
jgi:hypothetical protein